MDLVPITEVEAPDLSRPDPKRSTRGVTPRSGRSTRGNRCVPLSGFWFPKNQPKARKTFDNIACLKTKTQPDLSRLLNFRKYFNSRNSTEISAKFRLKYYLPPAKKKYLPRRNTI